MKLQNYRTIVISFTLLCFIPTYFATGEPNSNAFTSEEEWKVEFLELKNKSLVNWKDGFKNCGVPMEGCGKKQTDDRDYFIYPSFCRCDKECIKYGDCCVTVLKELKKIPKEPSWRCVQLPNSEHAVRMISKCPTSSPYNLDKQLCEEPENCLSGVPGFPHVNKSHHCPLLDVPVLHRHTRDLYRSLFCARCHNIANKQLYKIQEEIICSEQFKQDTSWDEFKYRANYTQGKLEWVDPLDPRFTCTRQIKEFYAENIEQYVHNVRFCTVIPDEKCSLRGDQDEEQRVIYNLCHSYTQIVYVPIGNEIADEFKNPHCAKCNYPSVKIKKTPMCHRLSERYPTSPVDSGTGTHKDKKYEDIDENKKYTNSNLLLTLLGISVFFLLVLLVSIYLLLSKKGVLKKFRTSLSRYNNNSI